MNAPTPTQSDETRQFPKDSSHDGKKPMSEAEAAEVVEGKPWYRAYKCQYCPDFHLTKTMNPRLWYKKHQTEIIDKAVAAERQRIYAAVEELVGADDYTDYQRELAASPEDMIRNKLRAQIRAAIKRLREGA